MTLVFLGGIHGAGKGVLGTHLATACGGMHFSAGEVISEERANHTREKRVGDIQGNQELLISGLETRLASDRVIILDGHFAVLDGAGAPRQVPLDTFQQLQPIGAIFLRIDPAESRKRLLARDRKAPTVGELDRLQTMAQAQALNVVGQLGIPLLVLSDALPELASAYVGQLISEVP